MTSISLEALRRRLEALDEAAWHRIAARVPALGGDSGSALHARGQAIAQGLPPAIPALARQAMGLAHAVLSEFPGRPAPTPGQVAGLPLPPTQKATATHAAAIATLLGARRAAYPGAVACIEAVLPALIAPVFIGRERLEALYAPIAPEIPLASLAEDAS
ncbi:MAG: hypothetical protein JNL26_19255 [Gemmatimonadetes bacterium]|nr:hypothetical protein [Gemmatimonadota bacterium]